MLNKIQVMIKKNSCYYIILVVKYIQFNITEYQLHTYVSRDIK